MSAPETVTTPIGADEVAPRSQARLILRRFLRHRLSVAGAAVFILIAVLGITASGLGPFPGWWHYHYSELTTLVNGGRPSLSIIPKWLGGAGIQLGDHPFGQDRIGKDYFAQVMRGITNSILVMVIVAAVATTVGTIIGAVAGFYRGWVDSALMRMTDLVIIIPMLVVAAVLGQIAGSAGGAVFLALLLGLLAWTNLARLVRAEFLSYREREFVDAARLAGVPDTRIIFKHILPNAVGVVIVAGTLIMAGAVLLESALSFLGLGIRPPDVSLGGLVSQNQSSALSRPWLFWWPGIFIILLALAVNFAGDGLRDAFDPRQGRFNSRKAARREQRAAEGTP